MVLLEPEWQVRGLFSKNCGAVTLFPAVHDSSDLFHIVSREQTFPPTAPARPPTRGVCRGAKKREGERTLLLLLLHPAPGFIHTPSLMRSMMSLTSKLISSVSWPVYWYRARQRGPVGLGWGLGAGRGRWVMLLFLCFLWRRHRNQRYSVKDKNEAVISFTSHFLQPLCPTWQTDR